MIHTMQEYRIIMHKTFSRRDAILGAGGAALAATLGGRFSAAVADDGTIRITTTIGMVADAVSNVGGDRVEVTALMGPGVDPHLYKPGASDIAALSEADSILFNGLHLEGKMSDTFDKMSQLGVPTTGIGDQVPEELLQAPPEFYQYDSPYDPHIWFSVPIWKVAVDITRDALIELSPDDEDTFTSNAAAYQLELDDLDAWVRERVETVPEELRVLITAHDAFGYFGEEYGFEVHGIQGLSTATEAGAGDIQKMADMLAEREIPAIFIESSISPATIEALQAASQSRGWDVAIGGELFSDAMGEDGTPEGTYIGMFEFNVNTIVGALNGEAGDE